MKGSGTDSLALRSRAALESFACGDDFRSTYGGNRG